MKIIHQHTVQSNPQNLRLQEYAVGLFDEIPTKSALKKAIKNHQILVNGEIATTAHFIQPQDLIQLLDPVIKLHKVFHIDLTVLWQDDYLAIIEKPAGSSVSGNTFATIVNALPKHITTSSQKDAVQAFPVHRLDYPTSGCLLIGKTASVKRDLHQYFEEGKINKTYYAVVVGKLLENVGIIDIDVEQKRAYTKYKVVKSIVSERFQALNLVELNPITGRKHQLRQHLFSIGNPIMGDQKYFLEGRKHQGNGLYLHAFSLEFIHPITQQHLKIISSLPKKFIRLFPEDAPYVV